MKRVRHVLIVSAVSVVNTSVSAQERAVLPWSRECTSCIILARSATLGDAEGPGAVAHPGKVVRDSRGYYYFSHSNQIDAVSVFDANGRFRQVVRPPRPVAPDYSNILVLAIGRADSLFVFDNGQSRCFVYGPDFKLARSFDVEGSVRDAIVLSTGDVLLNAVSRSSELIGLPLHLISSAGRFVRAFGAESPVSRPDLEAMNLRFLSVGSDGSIWSVGVGQYSLEQWSLAGKLLRTIHVQADWFRTPNEAATD